MTDLNSAQKYFENLVTGPVMVAFSGGADSILVLKLALHAAQRKFPIYALYADTPWMPRRALKEARDIAREFQIDLNVITIDRPEDIGIENNPKDRCYRCKKAIFNAFFAFGNEHGAKLLLEGTQLDDLTKYRPGLKAIEESGALSPLKELGLHKADVRRLLTELHIKSANKPSGSCLCTRLPYNCPLTLEALRRIEEAEAFLATLELESVRLRSHGDIARIEVSADQFDKALSLRLTLIEKIKALGWKYVTLDLEGFRSGSMD